MLVESHFLINKSALSLVPRLSTWHCPHLLLSAMLRRRCCWAPAPAVDRHLLLFERSAANAAAVDWWERRTDGRTDGRPILTQHRLRILCWQCKYNHHKNTKPAYENRLRNVNQIMLFSRWLGGRKGIRPVKKCVVGCWHGYLCRATCRHAYGPADATATHCLLLQ